MRWKEGFWLYRHTTGRARDEGRARTPLSHRGEGLGVRGASGSSAVRDEVRDRHRRQRLFCAAPHPRPLSLRREGRSRGIDRSSCPAAPRGEKGSPCMKRARFSPLSQGCLQGDHVSGSYIGKMERAMGFEPTTPTLARLCSTPELHPHAPWQPVRAPAVNNTASMALI